MFSHLWQLGKESIIYGFAGVATRLITVFLVPIYTRQFTKADYGAMSLVTILFSLAQIFMILALDSASYRWFYDTDDVQDRKRTIATWLWCEIVTAVLLSLLIFGFADWLALNVVRDAKATMYFRLSAVSLPFSVLTLIIVNWLRFNRRATTTVIFTLSTSLITISLNILFIVVLHWGVNSVYLAQIITNVLGTLLAAWIMREWVSPAFFRLSRLRELLRYSMPLIPASVASWTVMLSGRFFIDRYGNITDVAVYQLGATLAMIISLLVTAFQQAWGPFSMSIFKQPDAKKVYANVFLIYVWLISAGCTVLALFSKELVQIVAGKSYLSATSVVAVLGFSYLFIGLTAIANIGPSIAKRMAPAGFAIVISAFVNLGLNFLLVSRYGKMGAAIASLLAQMIVPVYIFYRAQQIYPIPYRFRSALGILAFSFTAIIVSAALPLDNFWIAMVVKLALLVLYIPLLFALHLISLENMKQAWSFFLGKVRSLAPKTS